ncbi:LysR family transcriptional regulator [Alicyclobacillus contaminans]|nr:LysR family transcriptional regulator [Alicyclobacillus contaminans]
MAVYRTESMSAAAQERQLTQPAVSQQMQALERELGASLFIRSPRKVVPTEAGKELYVSIAEAVDRLERTSKRHHPEHGPTLRLGAPYTYFHERCIRGVAGAPWRVRIDFGLTKDLLASLKNGELDIVIATQRLSDEGVQYIPLYEEQFALYLSPTWTIPQTSDLRRIHDWLVTLPWIAYGSELPIIRRYWQCIFGKRPGIRPKAIVPDLRCILQLVEQGAGVSVLPTYLCRSAEDAKRIQALQISDRIVSNQLWVVCRRKEVHDEFIRSAVDVLLATAHE